MAPVLRVKGKVPDYALWMRQAIECLEYSLAKCKANGEHIEAHFAQDAINNLKDIMREAFGDTWQTAHTGEVEPEEAQ